MRGEGPVLRVVGLSILWMWGCTKVIDPVGPNFDRSGPGAGAGMSVKEGGAGAIAGGFTGAGASGAAGLGSVSVMAGGGVAPQSVMGGVAMVGAACAPNAAKACAARESVGTLVCTNGKWVAGPNCAANQRCDTADGMTQGTCQPMLSLCNGKKVGDAICDGYTRRRCGNDLLRFEEFGCVENAHCEPMGGAKCACNLRYKDNGAGACVPDIMCPLNACRPGGECVPGETDYSCECGIDFEGTGTKACVPIGRCAEPHTCTAEYQCRNKDAAYVCLGQFADWPMPSRAMGAKAAPSYMPGVDTVVDTVTGLTWQRNLPETYPDCTHVCTWDLAKAYCDSLQLEGQKDWRLPSRIELISIVDDDAVMPSIDAEAFPNPPAEPFWTASTFAGSNTKAWTVKFGVFQSTAEPKVSAFRVRCVR